MLTEKEERDLSSAELSSFFLACLRFVLEGSPKSVGNVLGLHRYPIFMTVA